MKKLYLLSGMIVLSAVIAGLNAMEQRPVAWQELDQFTNQEPVNWNGVFRILRNYGNDLTLINKYQPNQEIEKFSNTSKSIDKSAGFCLSI